jgi:hypothetical protein
MPRTIGLAANTDSMHAFRNTGHNALPKGDTMIRVRFATGLFLLFTLILPIRGEAQDGNSRTDGSDRGAAASDGQLDKMNSLHGIFIAGSVLAAIGTGGIVISGTAPEAKVLGAVVFALGQAGIITCGVSTSLVKKNVLAKTGEKKEYYWEPGSGWKTYAASWGCFGAGIGGIILGIENDNGIIVIGSVALLGVGEVLQFLSWKRFLDGQAFWRRNYPGLSLRPVLKVDQRGLSLAGAQATVSF